MSTLEANIRNNKTSGELKIIRHKEMFQVLSMVDQKKTKMYLYL